MRPLTGVILTLSAGRRGGICCCHNHDAGVPSRFLAPLGILLIVVAALISVSLATAQTPTAPAYVGRGSSTRVLGSAARATRNTVRDVIFQSPSLARAMKYRILLPSDYGTSTHRYPVLYLLHGLQGDYTNWDTRTRLREDAAPLQLIVVMPDADDSWYLNS